LAFPAVARYRPQRLPSPSIAMSIARFVFTVALAAAFLTAQENGKPGTPVDAAAKTAQTPAVVTLGVVNLDKAIEQYPKWIKMKADLDAMSKSFDERLSAMSKQIREMRATIETMTEGSEPRRLKELAVSLAMQEQKGQAEILREQLDLEVARSQVAVFEDLEVAIAKVAKVRGLSLVLRTREIPKAADIAALSPRGIQARIAEFERKSVLFAAEPIDVTLEVIKVLMVPLDNGKPTETPKTGGQ
jgi:Skp family chaperone for outer membrane proteins